MKTHKTILTLLAITLAVIGTTTTVINPGETTRSQTPGTSSPRRSLATSTRSGRM